MLVVYVAFDRLLRTASRLPESDYLAKSYLPGLAASYLRADALILLAIVGLLVWKVPRRLGWSEIGRGLRGVALVATIVMVWAAAFYAPNEYLQQAHIWERVLLVALAALSVWRPLFLLPLLALMHTAMWQFDVPIPGYSWTDKLLPVRLLGVLAAAAVVRPLRKRPAIDVVPWFVLAIFGAHYWFPGWKKASIGWLEHSQVGQIAWAATENGWSSWVTENALDVVTALQPVLMVSVLLLELAACVVGVHRRVATLLSLGWVLMHLSIFAMTGIFFWKWIAVNIAFVVWLRRADLGPLEQRLPAVLVLVLAAPLWCQPPILAWYNTRVNERYEFVGVGETATGESRCVLTPPFFAPYDIAFSQHRFGFLLETPQLVRTYSSTTHRELADALNAATAETDLDQLAQELGRKRWNPKRREAFERFLTRFVPARAAAVATGSPFWRPPMHILSRPLTACSKRAEFEAVEVFWHRTLDGAPPEHGEQRLVLRAEL